MRMTKHRQAILDVLRSKHTALSASAIHRELPHIDLATIYRNLVAFNSSGSIKKLHLDGNESVFEYQHHPHYHAVCTKCDKVWHFSADNKKLEKVIALNNFNISDIEIVVRGQCSGQHLADK